MSNFKLNCLVYGDTHKRIFPVDIAQMQTVGDLKELIKEKKKHAFRDVDADSLEIWKVDLPVNETLERSLKSLTLDPKQSLSPVAEVLDVLKNPPKRGHLHIVVEAPPVASSGSLHLKLNCFVLGDEPSHIFPVDIAQMQTVGDLKELIKEKKKHAFRDVDAGSLDIWKVNIDSKDPHLLKSIEDEGDIKGGVKLNPTTRLSKVFTDVPEDEHIDIIVRHPVLTRGGSVEDLTDIMEKLNTGDDTLAGF